MKLELDLTCTAIVGGVRCQERGRHGAFMMYGIDLLMCEEHSIIVLGAWKSGLIENKSELRRTVNQFKVGSFRPVEIKDE